MKMKAALIPLLATAAAWPGRSRRRRRIPPPEPPRSGTGAGLPRYGDYPVHGRDQGRQARAARGDRPDLRARPEDVGGSGRRRSPPEAVATRAERPNGRIRHVQGRPAVRGSQGPSQRPRGATGQTRGGWTVSTNRRSVLAAVTPVRSGCGRRPMTMKAAASIALLGTAVGWPAAGTADAVAPPTAGGGAQAKQAEKEPEREISTESSPAHNRHVYRPPQRKRNVYDGSELRRALDAYDRRYEEVYRRVDPAIRRLEERRADRPAEIRSRIKERTRPEGEARRGRKAR